MKTISCIVISGDKKISDFMQAVDMFENFKVFATPQQLDVTLKPDSTIEGALSDLKKLFEAYGHRVVAIFIPSDPTGAYVDDSVKMISNGKTFGMLENALKGYQFVRTNPLCASQ